MSTRSAGVVSLVLVLAACRSGGSKAPSGERTTFDARAMHGWRCRLVEETTLGSVADGRTAIPVVRSAYEFTIVPGAEAGDLGLRFESAEQSVVGGARVVALDRERVVVGRGDEAQSQAKGDHPDVARVIEAATGAASLWVRVDSRGRRAQHAGKLDAVVRKMFDSIDAAGRTWWFGYPELPNELRAGERWQGLRAMPVAGESVDVRLDYHVDEVAADHAVIAIHHDAEMDLPAGLRGRMRIDGTSRIRRGDGAFLGATVTMIGTFTGTKGSVDLGSRIDSTCAPQ